MKTFLLAAALVFLPYLALAQEERPAVALANEDHIRLSEDEKPPESAPLTSSERAEEASESAKEAIPTVVTDPACPEGKVCVALEDMQTIMQVLRERQCLENTDPEFEFGEITLVVDADGRVFYQGDSFKTPFTMTMSWCHYRVLAGGPLKVTAAVMEDPIWGVRFRPKAYLGYMLLYPLFDGNKFSNGIDAGVMVDFLYWKSLNLNASVGFRTFGAGVGLDITENFGGYIGYGVSWEALIDPRRQPLSNVVIGVDFAF